jgi:hypothetical protein
MTRTSHLQISWAVSCGELRWGQFMTKIDAINYRKQEYAKQNAKAGNLKITCIKQKTKP